MRRQGCPWASACT